MAMSSTCPARVQMLRETGAAGVMVGRGAMRDPWSLLNIAQHLRGEPLTRPTATERHRVLVRFLEDQRPRFRTEQAALGRFKKVANHFCRGVPHGEQPAASSCAARRSRRRSGIADHYSRFSPPTKRIRQPSTVPRRVLNPPAAVGPSSGARCSLDGSAWTACGPRRV